MGDTGVAGEGVGGRGGGGLLCLRCALFFCSPSILLCCLATGLFCLCSSTAGRFDLLIV